MVHGAVRPLDESTGGMVAQACLADHLLYAWSAMIGCSLYDRPTVMLSLAYQSFACQRKRRYLLHYH